MPSPSPEMGALARFRAVCAERGWNPNTDFRMELDEDDLSDEDAAALEGFTVDDFEGLDELSDDEIAELAEIRDDETGVDREVARLKREAGKRRVELKPWKQLAREFNVTVDDVRQVLEAHLADDDTDGKDTKPARREQRDRGAEARANRKLVRAEVKLAAVDLFEDPSDAALYLDLDQYEVDDDGELLDPEELLEDLKDVLERKPHLAKVRERKSPRPLKSQGRREATTSGLDAGRERARARFGKSDDKAAR